MTDRTKQPVSRRTVLKRGAIVTGGLVLGGAASAGRVAAAPVAAEPVERITYDPTGDPVYNECTGEEYEITGGTIQVIERDLSPEDECVQDYLLTVAYQNVTAVDESGQEYRVVVNEHDRVKGNVCDGPLSVSVGLHGNLVEVGSGSSERITASVIAVINGNGDVVIESIEYVVDCPPE